MRTETLVYPVLFLAALFAAAMALGGCGGGGGAPPGPDPAVTAFSIDSLDPSPSATVSITFMATDPEGDLDRYLIREDNPATPVANVRSPDS